MVTIYDVAEHAGLSAMTVSRVLNHSTRVRPATRKKVEAAIHALGYQRNEAARALVTQKTGIVKIQMSQNLRGNHPYFSQLFAGITEVLSDHRMAMLVANETTESVACDGEILMGLTHDQQASLSASRRPRVLFGQGASGVPWIDVDNRLGTRLGTDHLLDLGHRHIGFLKFETQEPFIDAREAGYVDAMRAAGLAVREPWIARGLANSSQSGFEAAKSLLLQQPKLTALVCSSDPIAQGVLMAADELKRSVPEQLSVVGFDGVGVERTTRTIVTTLEQPVFYIGQQLASTLMAQIDGNHPDLATQQLIPPTLKLGDSTARYR